MLRLQLIHVSKLGSGYLKDVSDDCKLYMWTSTYSFKKEGYEICRSYICGYIWLEYDSLFSFKRLKDAIIFMELVLYSGYVTSVSLSKSSGSHPSRRF